MIIYRIMPEFMMIFTEIGLRPVIGIFEKLLRSKVMQFCTNAITVFIFAWMSINCIVNPYWKFIPFIIFDWQKHSVVIGMCSTIGTFIDNYFSSIRHNKSINLKRYFTFFTLHNKNLLQLRASVVKGDKMILSRLLTSLSNDCILS